MRVLHFGSYWMGKNDIVYAMTADLQKICQTLVIDVGIYNQNKAVWYTEDFGKKRTYPVRWLNHTKVIEEVKRFSPDVVICNAGGLTFLPKTFQYLKRKKIKSVGISLSDPDVFEDQGKVYYHWFDAFFTNSKFSWKSYYQAKHVHLLPFAASASVHRPLKIPKKYDIVVVGHARPERMKLVDQLKSHFSVKTFGDGWGEKSKSVQGIEQVKAINQGKTYLSFPQTLAGFTNVKVGMFEAAACKSCIVVPFFKELENYFTYGVDILGYTDFEMLKHLLREYLHNDRLRTWIAENAYQRFLQDHTWEKRWQYIFSKIADHA